MEIDTGSVVSIISEVEHKKLFRHLKLQPMQFHLKTYSGKSLPLLGKLQATVQYQTQEIQLSLLVAQGEKLCCLGRTGLRN